jgi:hypothetical protein
MGTVECFGTINRVMPEVHKSQNKVLYNYGDKLQITKASIGCKDDSVYSVSPHYK